MTVLQIEATAGRALVDPELFERLAARVVTEHDVDLSMAERVMDQALAFLGACATSTVPLSPSATVDVGWHTFILYTREYREFCHGIAGRFIDHVPMDDQSGECQRCQQRSKCQDEKPPSGEARPESLSARLSALAVAEAGFVVDEPLWESGGSCSQCHNGCHNDPPPDPKAF
jgi:hypothetical protein